MPNFWAALLAGGAIGAAASLLGAGVQHLVENRRWARTQCFDLLKWSADKAAGSDPRSAFLGMRFLRKLRDSKLVKKADEDLVDAALSIRTMAAWGLVAPERDRAGPDTEFEVSDDDEQD